ncbi:helix-turn-helix domain-containing protein [uncultured Alistipes sp.]|jgi:hypothetical protein|uniref:helix-turn-helix domain-containing protein n=1 Tax=uncultured Alistipes sp. TaxID=538949 RepID=UPI0025E4457D|nr:helix-turn-helix domain-containing protein [uncultured Alistipes sp.]
MDVQEVCQALKISKRSLQYQRQTGNIPYSMIGNKVYFKASEINELLDSQKSNNYGTY